MCSQKILLPGLCSCSLCSSLTLIFTLLVASISQFLTAVTKISCCSRNEIRLLLFISRFSSFSVIHVSIDTMKTKSNKDSAYLSFCLQVRQNVLVVEREISQSLTCRGGLTDGRRTDGQSRESQNFSLLQVTIVPYLLCTATNPQFLLATTTTRPLSYYLGQHPLGMTS